MARISKENALKRLKRALEKTSNVRGQKHGNSDFQKWKISTTQDLKRIFGSQSDYPRDFDHSLIIHLHEDSGTNVDRAAVLLNSWIEEISEDWPETEQASDGTNADDDLMHKGNKVFVIHGHDVAARETVARFLQKLGFEPIILHEQVNKGRTIIEKFEDHSDVPFAVVLLTPDDVGKPKDEKSELKPRARQNVILELGFFLGKLGRHRVCPLVKGNVETPSDYDGVIYTKLDGDDGWRIRLVRELKTAGFDVDANQAFLT